MSSNNLQQNDFSKGSIPKTILRLSGPLVIAQIINILYNVVDRMYIGRLPGVGRLALTGIGITMPVISIIMAFANLCGMGGAPLCSIARGAGDREKSERIMGNCFMLLVIFAAVLTAAGLIFKHQILFFFGASSATITYAEQYITIYLLGTVMVLITVGMNPFINLQGFTKIGMMTTALGAAVNIVLDPIFIFVLNMGIRGAAIATVISQTCSAVWVMRFLTGKRAILKLKIKNLRLKAEIVGRTIALGASGFVMSITNSLVQIVCNKTLLAYGGDMYVSAMTVINSVRDIAFAAANGLSGGASPVLGYNYGAKEYERVRQSIRFTTAATVGCAAVISVLILAFPAPLIRIFNSDAELVKVGVPAMRIYFCMFVIMAFQLVGQTISVALGRAKTAICFSLLRKAALVAPLTVLLPKITGLGVMGVFAAEPISNVIGGMACYITMIITIYIPLGKMARGELDMLPGAAISKEKK